MTDAQFEVIKEAFMALLSDERCECEQEPLDDGSGRVHTLYECVVCRAFRHLQNFGQEED